MYQEDKNIDLKLILIPFKKFCRNDSDVVALFDSIFKNIQEKQDLSKFSILSKLKNQKGFCNAIILQPNFMGFGIDLKELLSNIFRKK